MQISRVAERCGCDSVSRSTDLMSVTDAVDCALAQVRPIFETESVDLTCVAGRTSAQAVAAPTAMPFFDNSAMDGFAVRSADLDRRCCLPVTGTIAAGDAPRALPAGAAMRIYTGAPLPAGADAVAMSEVCIDKSHKVHFERKPAPGENIRRAGSDQKAGQDLITAGTRLAAHHVGLLAANGITHICVVRRPRVAILSTGNELCDGTRHPGQIHDANRPMLAALSRQAGAEVLDFGILPDDPQASSRAFAGLVGKADLILTSGAVSMGGKDHIRDALRAAGGEISGWRVALKPGKPVMFGRLGQSAVTGLPGNPFAVHVGFHLFVLPQLDRLLGRPRSGFAPVPAIAGFDWIRKPGRAEVFPVRLIAYDANGAPVLQRLGQSVSATLLPVTTADGLAVVPADADHIRSGMPLVWHPFCQTGDVG